MVALAGCSGSLKSSWVDFRAYYNTFHNAKKSYHEGIDQVKRQPRELDPSSPVRVHIPPVKAGDEHFEAAISKSVNVIRKFPESKWTDDALFLIGRSYYYRREFYPALEKFEELYGTSTSDRMKQLAVIWKGITLLELSDYDEGTGYLRSERQKATLNWFPELLAETKITEAEHHALAGNWDQSADLLSSAITDISNKEMRGRSFFLFGQVLQKIGRYGEAFFAYSKVSENFTGFEYNYWAALKQVETARLEGNFELALNLLNRLTNDDKYFDRRHELLFETAHTYELKGEVESAVKMYLDLLSDRSAARTDNSFRSTVHLRLGHIYSEFYDKFDLAEAYFDSASSYSEGSEGEQAELLAVNYRTYNTLKNRIRHADSLLWLSTLPEEKLDSVLQVVQKRNDEEADKEQNKIERIRNTELVVEEQLVTDSSTDGFLNYKNNRSAEEARREFQRVWGNRPLVDNWRRIEAVDNETLRQDVFTLKSEVSGRDTTEEVVSADEIPSGEIEREQLRREIIKAKYELGNLFFLTMNKPDSALHYYLQVIGQSNSDSRFRPMAMYSLFELYNVLEEKDSLHTWGNRIIGEFPDSEYALRVKDRWGIADATESDSLEVELREKYELISRAEPDTGTNAARLRALALENSDSKLAPYIHFRAIEGYINNAKSTSAVDDTASTFNGNTILPSEEKDSGAEWDSVRIVLQEHISLFNQSPHRDQVSLLLDTLSDRQY